jgi:hypothetical protein
MRWTSSSLRQPKMREAYLACMRSFGSVENILTMIESDQGEELRERVKAIREDLTGMWNLRKLWEDKRLDGLGERFITGSDPEAVVTPVYYTPQK